MLRYREFASQITGKRVRNSNPKAVVDVKIDNELLKPRVEVEYCWCAWFSLLVVNCHKSSTDTTNMSFKKILHTVQDEILEVQLEADKANFDKFRQQNHNYIMSEIKRWEDLHKQMIKEQEAK